MIDERKGRQKAIELLLKPVGVLGVLLRAKQDNLIPEVTTLLDRLIDEADFFIHENLYNEVKALAGE